VAKYVGKEFREFVPPNVRRWGCFGFTGVPVSRIEKTISVDNLITFDQETDGICYGLRFLLCDGSQITVNYRHDNRPGDPLKMVKLTPFVEKEIVSLVAAGKLVTLGEYRTCSVREIKFTDKKTEQEVSKNIIEHGFEFGSGTTSSQVSVSEFLPDGADTKSVKPPADKGDICILVVSKVSQQYGYSAESIRPIKSLA